MICKKCKNQIPDGAIYCQYCGARQIAAPRKRAAERAITVPKPRQVSSGTWFIQLRLGGESIPVTGETAEACADAARVIKAKHFAGQAAVRQSNKDPTLEAACKGYVARRSEVLSPSTINGYEAIIRTRFQTYMPKRLSKIDCQRMINDELKGDGDNAVSAKTVKNAWGFVASVMRDAGISPPKVQLPQIVHKELPWLDYEQIEAFLAAVKGQPCELAALFALHGLRKSELLALTPASISGNMIQVAGSVVMGPGNKPVKKDTNKNVSSRRSVAIKIPRLTELLSEWHGDVNDPYVSYNINTLHGQINAVCRRAGLPEVGVHGLRRSFASLAYHLGWSELETMQEGGWSDFQTMRSMYIKLAKRDAAKGIKRMTRFYKKIDKAANNANSNAN